MGCHSTLQNDYIKRLKVAPRQAVIHIPWIICLGSNAIELSSVCLMRSFWKLVLRFKCCRSKSTQMVSSLLYFNLWRCPVCAVQTQPRKQKEWPFDMRHVLKHWNFLLFQVAQNGSDLYIFSSWLRTLAYEKFSRGLFLACRLQFFFVIFLLRLV